MEVKFEEVMDAYKELNDTEKQVAIIEFLKKEIITMQKLNEQLGYNNSAKDLNEIVSNDADNYLDINYQLLHVLAEQIENYVEKIANDYYE